MKSVRIFILFFPFFVACQHSPQPTSTPWGDTLRTVGETVAAEESFDLDAIERSGQLIALTVSGPETYYDYHGRTLGKHAMLCQLLADSLGVRLRVDLCKDTAEMNARLQQGEGDIALYPYQQPDGHIAKWRTAEGKPMLAQIVDRWYTEERMARVVEEEKSLFTKERVHRHVYAPMLSREGGIISRYDGLFVKYSREINWDWRLIAAQCYQESAFDPQAVSWTGARGLMQIMPGTAEHLGVKTESLGNPEQNISTAIQYMGKLERSFSDIGHRRERQDFVLAAYNGGAHHIRDAMALAARDGKDAHRWSVVSEYVVLLSQPQYYNDPLVRHGYMRGSETAGYVSSIRSRYQQYKAVRGGAGNSSPRKSVNKRHKSKYSL